MKIKVDYQVDEGVPIPVRNETVPIKDLKAGESILFPTELRAKVQSNASHMSKRTGKEFTIKKISNINSRVWRVK